jgi:NAD(P)H-dependent nitrite reductase small subunit
MNNWQSVCTLDDLQPDSGVCVLIENLQVAIFYMPKEDSVYALDNYDPFGCANVLSRGIIGDLNGQPVVSSPLHKQHFNLNTGSCLEDETVTIPVYAIRINQGSVQISITHA